jgi:hypothetical protein
VTTAWAEFERAEPELAAFGRERFEGRVVYHATLRMDGSPRVHPVSPWFDAGLMAVCFRTRSPKVAEIARDGRYSMHSSQPERDHEGEAGEFLVSGWMEQVAPDHPIVAARPYTGSNEVGYYTYYVCSADEAVATTYPGGGPPVYRRWRAE